MSQAEFSVYRPLLFSIAYRMVGCAATAEDLVQDTFLNWLKTEQIRVNDSKAYLTRSITNTCINYLSSLRKKKEEIIDQVSSSFPNISFHPDLSSLDLKCEITQALNLVLKKLAPPERAVFMLKGLFNFEYSEVVSILGKKKDNCRQLFSRAQQKLTDEKERFHVDSEQLRNYAQAFKKATLGEFNTLIDNLKKDLD